MDEQGWILFRRFISTGGTLQDRKCPSASTAGSRPEGSTCPSDARATPEQPPRQDTKVLTAAPELLQALCTLEDWWVRGKRDGKGEVMSDPQVVRRAVTRRTLQKGLDYCPVEGTTWLAFQKSPKAQVHMAV